MSQARRLGAGAALLLMVTVSGISGFMIAEDLGFLDSLYLAVITISTVGFGEPEGGFSSAGKAIAIWMILGGAGSALYTASVAVEVAFGKLLGGEIQRRRMRKQIDQMEDHVILCGWGKVGRGVWEQLQQIHESECVVIERADDTVEEARREGVNIVVGDATYDETLIEAGIDRAKSLIACVRNDADNLVIVLSAKARRPELFVVSRATDVHSEPKLRLAGADRVVAPQVVGALRLATLATGQGVADYFDLVVQGRLLEFQVEQFQVAASSSAAGRTLRDADVGPQDRDVGAGRGGRRRRGPRESWCRPRAQGRPNRLRSGDREPGSRVPEAGRRFGLDVPV